MAIKVSPADIIGSIAAAKAFINPSKTSDQFSNGQFTGVGKWGHFLAEMRSRSVARTNLFEVSFTPPLMLARQSGTARLLSLYASDASLPGNFINTMTLKRFGIGPNEKVPYSTQWNDIGFSCIGDGQGMVYKFFYKWMQGIVKSDVPITGDDIGYNQLASYEVGFKEEYATTITINTFDEQGKDILVYQLTGAYPIFISDTPLSWGQGDELQRIPLAFNFLQASLVNVEAVRSLEKNGQRELSPFEKLYKVGTAVQALASLRKPRSVGDVINVVSNAKTVIQGIGGTI